MYVEMYKNLNYLTNVIILKIETFKNSIYKLCSRLFDIDKVIFINFFFCNYTFFIVFHDQCHVVSTVHYWWSIWFFCRHTTTT